MKSIYNDVFRLVNLRGSKDDLSIDPEDDDDIEPIEGPVVTRILDPGFIPGERNTAVLEELAQEVSQVGASIVNSPLARLARSLVSTSTGTTQIDPSTEISYGDQNVRIKDLSENEAFKKDFSNVYNVWLLAKLWKPEKAVLKPLEDQLRAGYWIYKEAKNKVAPITPFKKSTFFGKPISLPKVLRNKITYEKHELRIAALRERQGAAATLQTGDPGETYHTQKRNIEIYKNLEKRLHSILIETATTQDQTFQDQIIQGKTKTGLFQRIAEFFLGRQAKKTKVTRSVSTIRKVDPALVAEMKAGLSPEEASVLDATLSELGDQPSVQNTLDTFSRRRKAAITLSNQAFTGLLYAEVFDKFQLPEPTQHDPVFENGAVQALGWGDLIVATETLINYEAREIAHIENILPNEKKNREHRRSETIVESFETETTETEESERELESTTRHELQVESEKSIDQEFSVQAGVNTSGRYGLTKVETSLNAGFNRSTREAQTATTNIAKEIVSKAVERTFKSVRELRRRTVTTEVVDTNAHEINNIPAGGGSALAISGIYKWVEKVHEIQLRHYGTRMMVEFSIPEPALSIVGRVNEVDVDMDEPVPPDFDASGIDESNYLAYAKQYRAVGIYPPPDEFIQVGFAWSSQPSESENEDTSEDVLAELIAIPEHYWPTSGLISLSAHPSDADDFQVRIQIAGLQFSQDSDATFNQPFTLTNNSAEAPWPGGVPVSMTAHGHFDKTLSLNVVLDCSRSIAAFEQWQIKIFDALQAGYERQFQEYNEAVETARLQQGIRIIPEGSPDAINRRTEREELQKWSTKILRREAFDLDAVISFGAGAKAHNEIDPGRADQQAPLVRFYEEAFEWDLMSYFFYPYFWGRRDAWNVRQSIRHTDYRFETFLRAGAARVIVPVTPGYEAKILFYLANPDLSEKERIEGPEDLDPAGDPPDSVADSVYETMWLELALNKNDELALGSGFLNVTKGSQAVSIVDSSWNATERDIGRELFIDGNRYEVESVVDSKNFTLSGKYEGESNPKAAYATGSVAFGPPWVVNLPTNLVVLNDNRDDVRLQ